MVWNVMCRWNLLLYSKSYSKFKQKHTFKHSNWDRQNYLSTNLQFLFWYSADKYWIRERLVYAFQSKVHFFQLFYSIFCSVHSLILLNVTFIKQSNFSIEIKRNSHFIMNIKHQFLHRYRWNFSIIWLGNSVSFCCYKNRQKKITK